MTEIDPDANAGLETALCAASDERVLTSFNQALNAYTKRAANNRLQRILSMKKYILTSIMVALLIGQAYFFGVSDALVLVFVAVTALFMYNSIIKLYEGNRRTLRIYSKEGSLLHAFLSKKRTFLMRMLALTSALILSCILVFLIKGMVLMQGYWAFFAIIVIASLVLYSFVNEVTAPAMVNNNLHQDISAHGNEILRLFYATLILNFVLALTFSAHDTYVFKTSDVNFNNFTDRAVEKAFEKTESNEYSRIFINAYLLMDYAKVALTKVFVDLFDLHDNFYGFYVIISILNIFKMFAFSLSFILLQKGFDGAANALVMPTKRAILKLREGFDKSSDVLMPIAKEKWQKGLDTTNETLLPKAKSKLKAGFLNASSLLIPKIKKIQLNATNFFEEKFKKNK